MTTVDPETVIAREPMSAAQITAIALCVLLNALDGFDVLSISFAAPGIARDWGIDRAALGVVLSMELIGMTAGSLLLGTLCDRVGRRRAILASLVLMAVGMAAASVASSILMLSGCRLFTGLGIGGMLAATNAVVAEHSNARRRSLAVAIMAGGYPVGAVVGGALVSAFVLDHGWRAVFASGAVASALCIPLVWLLLPETVAWLVRRRPSAALPRVNRTLVRMGREPVAELPPAPEVRARIGMARLLAPTLAPVTLLLTFAYLAHILTFYFILKWAPKIVVDMGFAPSAAGGVLVWANVGGIAGSLALSLLTQRVDVRALTIASMVVACLFVAAFGFAPANLRDLSLLAAIASFFTNAGVVGLYAIVAEAFPTEVRAGGTGFVIGVGRGGAALSPILAGLLLSGGAGRPAVAAVMGTGALVAALLLGAYARLGTRTALRAREAA